MIKKIFIISQLFILLSIESFSQSDTTVCIDFNPNINQKIRKNILSIDAFTVDNITDFHFGLSYERILKENKSLTVNFSRDFGFYNNLRFNVIYQLYFSNMKYGKVKYKNDTYFIRKQCKNMLSPKGLYVGLMTHFDIRYNYLKIISSGMGFSLGYQFIFFNRISLNPSLQLPLSIDWHYDRSYAQYEYSGFYVIRPKLIFNINFGIAF